MTEDTSEAKRSRKTMKIDIGKAAVGGRRVVSGRSSGEALKKQLGGSAEFEKFEMFELIVPVGIELVTPSFFAGLIGQEFSRFKDFEDASANVTIIGAKGLTLQNFRTAIRSSFASPL
jgi:hypothetical protein